MKHVEVRLDRVARFGAVQIAAVFYVARKPKAAQKLAKLIRLFTG